MNLKTLWFNEQNDDPRTISKIPTQGWATWMTPQQKETFFLVCPPNQTDETIYGYYEGELVCSFKFLQDRATGNKNVFMQSPSGQGKTTNFTLTDLLQICVRGESVVVLDPKGEAFELLENLFHQEGYDVHLLNILDFSHSEMCNILEETIDPYTERMDPQLLTEFVNIYTHNMEEDAKPFWNENTANLVQTVIGYEAFRYERFVTNMFSLLYIKVANATHDDPFVNYISKHMVSFKTIKDRIFEQGKIHGYDQEDIQKIIDYIQSPLLNTYTVESVVEFLLNFDENVDLLADIPKWHNARYFYKTFKANPAPEVYGAAVQGALKAFKIFGDKNTCAALSNNGIHLRNINKKKTALFVITDDKTNTKKQITSLIFSFIFKDAMQNHDDWTKKHGEACVPMTLMMDEFPSIGTMFGSPTEFVQKLQTCRSRDITLKMIVQDWEQFKNLYGELSHSIFGGCSTKLTLGCGDLSSAEMWSRFIGDGTFKDVSDTKQAGILNARKVGETVHNIRGPLVGVEQLRGWDSNNMLLVRQGSCAVASLPVFPWYQHPYVKQGYLEAECIDGKWKGSNLTKIDDFISPIEERIEKINMEKENLGDAETEINKIIRNLEPNPFV